MKVVIIGITGRIGKRIARVQMFEGSASDTDVLLAAFRDADVVITCFRPVSRILRPMAAKYGVCWMP